jgi:type II secretory pathway pseudopilin PulG
MAKKTAPWAYLTLLLAAMVGLAMTPLASAQDQSQSATQNQQNKVTATGCLQQAASGNGYQLTDSASMKTYDLVASGNVDLSSEVGHTITVTGTTSAATAANQEPGQQPGQEPGANPAGASQQNEQLTVEKMKKVSDTCQPGGGH